MPTRSLSLFKADDSVAPSIIIPLRGSLRKVRSYSTIFLHFFLAFQVVQEADIYIDAGCLTTLESRHLQTNGTPILPCTLYEMKH